MKRLLLLILAISMIPLAHAQTEKTPISSVCLVTGGGTVTDGGFNQFAYEGMNRAEEDFELITRTIEPQAPADFPTAIDACLEDGSDAIVTVGWTIYDVTLAAAEANPDVYFIGVDHFDTGGLPNYVGLDFRDDQAGFLMGVLAALVTESDHVAAVYGPPDPQILRFRNGFEQGVRYIDPEIDVDAIHLDSYEDPISGASAGQVFVGDGADVIFGAGGPTGTGAITAAAQEGIWVIGVDKDEYVTSFDNGETEGADKIISSAIKRIDIAVYEMLKVLAEGDFENFPGGSNYVSSAANGGIDFAPKHDADIPDEVYEQVNEVRELLASGELDTGVDPVTGVLLEEEIEATEEPGS